MVTMLIVPQPSASSLWAKAVDELPDEHKHGIDFTNSEKIDILKDLREKAENSRSQFLASRWKYTRKSGETVIMRDLFEKLVRWLDVFKQIGDVAVQYDAAHASLPWAGIRLILQIAVNDTKKLESVMEDLTWISELICRYTVIEVLYTYDTSAAHKELENAVVKLYANILSHLSYITKYFGQGTAKRLLKSTGSDYTFDSSLNDIRKSEQRVEEWRSLADRNDNIRQNSKLIDLLNAMDQPLKRINRSLEKVADNLERSKRITVLQWLSSEPYLGHHKQVKEGLLKDTGRWLLNDPIFKKWKDDSASSILWLHGIAGSGKSKLVSVVIDDAINNFQAGYNPQPVFFYCSRNPAEPTRSNPRAILASIARQLSAIAPGKPLLKPTVEMYEKEEDQGFVSGPLNIREICELITQLIEVYPQTTIVIDAMDECDPQNRGELLGFLEKILQNASSLVKIFVSSRDDQDIVHKLKSYPNLHINSQSNGEDIERFVEHEVDRLIHQKKLLRHSQSPDQLKKLIVSETVKGAHEMFRWASMQLQHLSLLTLDEDIKKALGRLPPDLRTLYNELYNLLSETPGELRATIFKNALHWLLSAQTTLESEEFLTAVTVIPNEEQRVPITQEQLLDICNNFIVYDSQIRTYRFAHLSVREFLEGRPEFSVPSSNGLIAETCLWTLLSMNPSPATQTLFRRLNWKIKVDHPVIIELKGYTDLFWGYHCRLAGEKRKSGPLRAALEYLFLKENGDRSILFSNEKNQKPKSTIALWVDRVDGILKHRGFYFTSKVSDGMPLEHQMLVGTFYEIKERDIYRVRTSEASTQLGSCIFKAIPPACTILFAICAYDLEELGRELLVGEVLTRQYSNFNGRSIYRVAGLCRSHGVMLHLITQENFGAAFAEEMVGFPSVDRCKDVAKALIKHWKTDAPSRKVVLMTAMRERSKEVVEEFLNAWKDVPITQEMVEVATENRYFAPELINLLQQRNAELKVTQKMVMRAIRRYFDSVPLVKVLFRHSKAKVKVTQEMVMHALKHHPLSVELVEFLLKEAGEEIKITQEFLIDAVRKTNIRVQMVEFLLMSNKTDIGVTQQMMETALNSRYSDLPLIGFLLKQSREDVIVTQRMIERAVRISVNPIGLVCFLSEKLTQDIIITEETVDAIRGKMGRDIMMGAFLDKRKKDLPIATPVVTTIFKYLDMELLKVLVEKCGIEAVITIENIDAVAQCGSDEQDMLIELFKKQAGVLDVFIRAAQTIHEKSQWAKLAFQFELSGSDRCRFKFLKYRRCWHCLLRSENGWEFERA